MHVSLQSAVEDTVSHLEIHSTASGCNATVTESEQEFHSHGRRHNTDMHVRDPKQINGYLGLLVCIKLSLACQRNKYESPIPVLGYLLNRS